MHVKMFVKKIRWYLRLLLPIGLLIYITTYTHLNPGHQNDDVRQVRFTENTEDNAEYVADHFEPLRTYLAGTDHSTKLTFRLLNNIPLLRQPSPCTQNTKLVVVVHSAPDHHILRDAIRHTWAAPGTFGDAHIVFIIGQPQNDSVQAAILAEVVQYDDIAQFDYVDTYHNLTYKHLLAYHWVIQNCIDVPSFIKCDDDIIINMYTVTKFLHRMQGRYNGYYCQKLENTKPIREGDYKVKVTKEEYPNDYFPTYCSGMVYIIDTKWLPLLYNAVSGMPYFWVDDAFVTGLLAARAEIGHDGFKQGYGQILISNTTDREKIEKNLFLWMENFKTEEMFVKMWQIIKDKWENTIKTENLEQTTHQQL